MPLVMVASTRGNIGVSALSAGVASEFSSRLSQDTGGCLLIDACPKGGQIAPRLGLRSHPNLVGLVSSASETAVRTRARRQELWWTHAQKTRRARRPLLVVASPGEPLSAYWSTQTNMPLIAEFLRLVAEDGMPIVCDAGELSPIAQLGWTLLPHTTLLVLIVSGDRSPVSDLDLVYAACSQAPRVLLLAPATKRDRDNTVGLWAQAVLGGWGPYRKQLLARSNVDVRISEHLFAGSAFLGISTINTAQQELMQAETGHGMLRVTAPESVLWLPRQPGPADLCQRGLVPSGPFGKTISNICDSALSSDVVLIRKQRTQKKPNKKLTAGLSKSKSDRPAKEGSAL